MITGLISLVTNGHAKNVIVILATVLAGLSAYNLILSIKMKKKSIKEYSGFNSIGTQPMKSMWP